MKVKGESLDQYDLVDGGYIDKVARRYEARIGVSVRRTTGRRRVESA
jgi:hypothetical protein